MDDPRDSYPVNIARRGSSSPLVVRFSVFTLVRSRSFGLPDPAIAFDRAEFGFGIWGQGAPAGLGTQLYAGTEGHVSGTQVSSYPEGTH